MENLRVRVPKKGDIVVINQDKVEYIDFASFNKSTLEQGVECVGVVAWRDGERVAVLDKNQTTLKWAGVYMWKVSGWDLDGIEHTTKVTFHSSQTPATNPNFTYTASTIAEVVVALNAWFETYKAQTNKAYHCYELDENTIQVVKDVYENWYEYELQMSGLKVDYDIAPNEPRTGSCYSLNNKSGAYRGMNWEKFVEYFRTAASSSFNPSTPQTSLPSNPLSLVAYLGTGEQGDQCAALRAIYGEGEEGWLKLLATYMAKYPTMRGIFGEGYKETERISEYLGSLQYKDAEGIYHPTCDAANYCENIEYNHPSLAKGKWHLPTMDDLYRIYNEVKIDKTDILNMALKAIGGSTLNMEGVWSSSRGGLSDAWIFSGWSGSAYNYVVLYSRYRVVSFAFLTIGR